MIDLDLVYKQSKDVEYQDLARLQTNCDERL
jgi:hypothetical protein